MNELQTRFTPSQIQTLVEAGFTSLYSVLTYLPYKLNTIEPIKQESSFAFSSSPSLKQGVKYLFDGVLTGVEQRPGKRKFLVLEWGQWPFKTYLFSVTKFTLPSLKIGQNFQCLLAYKDGFWNVQKFTIKKSTLISSHFVLGQAESRSYLEPQYERVKNIAQSAWLRLHQRLQPQDYLLNLSGLMPKNSIIPEFLDLSSIHRPSDQESFDQALHQWIALKTFLRMSLIKYVELKRKITQVEAGKLDLEFLKVASESLPFKLSNSQKQIIWEVLQEVTIE